MPIPHVELHYWKEFGVTPRRVALIKFIAGVISIGAGRVSDEEDGITHRSSRLHLLVELESRVVYSRNLRKTYP